MDVSKPLPSSTSTSHTYISNADESLLAPRDEEADFIDHDGCYSEHGRLLCGPNIAPNPHGDLPVYMTIHRLVIFQWLVDMQYHRMELLGGDVNKLMCLVNIRIADRVIL